MSISAFADQQSNVRIGIGVESVDPGQSYGWNVDELIVKDATQPDYLACSDCSGAPSFGGLRSAVDPAPCATSGVTLSWDAATAWGSGDSGSYEVYRDADANFVPGPGNLVADGIDTTVWTDLDAPVDTTVYYVVRARNDENCTGGVGLTENNLVRISARDTVTVDPLGDLQESVRVNAPGKAHVRLSWAEVPGAVSYRVRRSNAADFSGAVELGVTSETHFDDLDEAQSATFRTYRVTVIDSCGNEQP